MRRLVATLTLIVTASSVLAADGIRTERVQFAPGASSATVEARITGREAVDYVLGASASQYANISMATDNTANYFNIIAPGQGDVAFFNGSTAPGGNQYEGVLPATGDYTVRVYLFRAAAQRGETANYRLEMIIGESAGTSQAATAPAEVPAAPEDGGPRHWEVTAGSLNLRDGPSASANSLATYGAGTILDNLGCQRAEGRVWCDVQQLGGGPRGYVAADYLAPALSPDGTPASGPDDSALRAGQGDFDATGQIPCAQAAGQPTDQCAFGVARAGGGAATVVVTRPDGGKRVIFFANGQAIGADTSEADRTGPFSASREADLNLIRVGDERYEIPDAVILGG